MLVENNMRVLVKVVDQWSETYELRKNVSEDDFLVVIGRIIQVIGKYGM